MFNTAQKDIIESLVPVMRKEGYNFYVAYTNTNTNSGYNRTVPPDLYVVFSRDNLSFNSAYSFNCPDGSVLFTCRTVNYSSSQYGVNTDRIVKSNISGNVTVEKYEHIYTNAEYSTSVGVRHPDILYSMEGGYAYDSSVALIIAICAVLLFSVFSSIIRIRSK